MNNSFTLTHKEMTRFNISMSEAIKTVEWAFKNSKGSEIIVPETTWIGTVSGLCNQKLKPVFVDVNKSDWNINEKSILENITKKTKLIFVEIISVKIKSCAKV